MEAVVAKERILILMFVIGVDFGIHLMRFVET